MRQPKTLDPLTAETLVGSLRKVAAPFDFLDAKDRNAELGFATEFMTALGNATRIRIVSLLRAGPMSVGSIARGLGLPQANASQHLAVLLRAGVLVRDAEGATRKYSLREPAVATILDLLEEIWLAHREDIEAERLG